MIHAFEVQRYDEDNRNIVEKRWFEHEAVAREDAIDLLRRFGPGSIKLMLIEWCGASSENPLVCPFKMDELPIVDPQDPDVLEFQRLMRKFKGLHVPEVPVDVDKET